MTEMGAGHVAGDQLERAAVSSAVDPSLHLQAWSRSIFPKSLLVDGSHRLLEKGVHGGRTTFRTT